MIDSDLLRYNVQNKKFVCYDFEGDLNTYFTTPFQLGFVIIENGKVVKEYDFYLKWKDLHISTFVKKYAHFNPDRMEKHGVKPIDAFIELEKYINNPEYYSIGANILGFDTMVTYRCFEKLFLKHNWDFLDRTYDTNALFKMYKLGIKPDSKNLLAQQYSANNLVLKGLKSNVSLVAREFGVPFDENRMHDGAYDVTIISKNFFELIKKMDIK